MDTQILPAYGSHDDFSTHIERAETLLFNALLLPTALGSYGARAVMVSRSASGLHWLRVCEGSDERWMRWTEQRRSEEHTSELQSLMRISYALFCLTKKACTPPI